jgi:zinc protease
MKKPSFILAILSFLFIFSISINATLASDKFLDIQEVKTPHGFNAWLVEDHTLPIISIKFSFKNAGSKNATESTQGITRLLSSTLDEGAGEYDSQRFQQALLNHSISLSYTSNRDHFSGDLLTLTKYKDKALELLKLSLNEPRFDEEALVRMKNAISSAIRNKITDPEWIAYRVLLDKAYSGHPYALNSGGTLSTIPNLLKQDLVDYKTSFLTKDSLVISAVGDISATELATIIDDIFSELPESSKAEPLSQIDIQNGGKVFLYEKDIPQTIIEIMQPGIDRSSPDYFTAQILNFILGGSGFGSRLTEELREKRGLTYGVYSSFSMREHADALTISTSTKNESAKECLDLIQAELNKFIDTFITDEELSNAKSYLIGSMPLTLSSTSNITSLIHNLQLDSMPIDYLDTRASKLNAVSKNEIKALAEKLLTPNNLTISLVGKPRGINVTESIKELPNTK